MQVTRKALRPINLACQSMQAPTQRHFSLQSKKDDLPMQNPQYHSSSQREISPGRKGFYKSYQPRPMSLQAQQQLEDLREQVEQAAKDSYEASKSFSQSPQQVGEQTRTPSSPESVFAADSTPELIKKYFIYKMMGSNLFIDYALGGLKVAYKLCGMRLTNLLIEKSAGTIFTGGVTLADVQRDAQIMQKRNIGVVPMFVCEGLKDVSHDQLDEFLDFTLTSIKTMSHGKTNGGDMAIKLTAFVDAQLVEKLSTAQDQFVDQILNLTHDSQNQSQLSRETLIQNLTRIGVTSYTRQDFESFFNQLAEGTNDNQQISNIARYKNGHLFLLDGALGPIREQIARKFANLSEKDFADLNRFKWRVQQICEQADESNCRLYVDAEQTFIQGAIESFGQQMTHKLNQGRKTLVMNGYQCYLKRMGKTLAMEVLAAKTFGFNLGVKMVRGAYMNEERALAEENGYESPVWDSIEESHECYNSAMAHIIENLGEKDLLFVASHNKDSVEIATRMSEQLGIKDRQQVIFGQLRGFSDQVTAKLAQDGFRVFKYSPFGPTEQVMPYLVRRGQESRQVLREQEYQNKFLVEEIRARLRL